MKKIYLTYSLLIAILLTSCGEPEVIKLNLDTAKERLVIEALIKWEEETLGRTQTIKLSKTTPYYNNAIVPAKGAIVTITDSNGTVFNFTENTDGNYTTNSFLPELNREYSLKIEYNNEIYVATETLLPVPTIDDVTQTIEDDIYEVTAKFTDTKDQDNFYSVMYSFPSLTDDSHEREQQVFSDEFEDGQVISISYVTDDEITAGTEVVVELQNISEKYMDYLYLLRSLIEPGEGPFTIPPSNAKGNCINTTNADNYPYGYFSLNQVSKRKYYFK